jgi:hypothetical protein
MQDLVNEINKMNRVSSHLLSADQKNEFCSAGDRLHENSRGWLSPPDPSQNQVIARLHNYDGSAMWLTRGDTFEKWNTKGGLLWIYGKRT